MKFGALSVNFGGESGTSSIYSPNKLLKVKHCRSGLHLMPSIQNQLSERPLKRLKIDQNGSADPAELFSDGLLDEASTEKHAQLYNASQPYHHSLIRTLFQDALVRAVRVEIKENLVFTEKETDIYRVNQTGDLANLDGLGSDELAKLKNIARLRNALYSERFRAFLRKVTGVGPLSGTKIDMSINNYTQGCHLLNHDDVIGTRSISYILYLPDPDEPWLPEYGGALELYPVRSKGIPVDEPSLILPPDWNQLIMFAVQPGHSFHSVEEVVVKGKERLSISGWFHVAQEGEDGYSPNANAKEKDQEEIELSKSTLEQLLSSSEDGYEDYRDAHPEGLSEQERSDLSELLNPQYLSMRTLEQMNNKFCDESQIHLTDILRKDVADKLKQLLQDKDASDGIIANHMTPHGTGNGHGWRVHGPPHRHRYVVLDPEEKTEDKDEAAKFLDKIQTCLHSQAFRVWLNTITSTCLLARKSVVRRFRPGLDYTLATSNDQVLVEVNLSLTPPRDVDWEEGEAGGYCCFMAPNTDEDAAVYKASTTDDEDGVLLTTQAEWNNMTIVMRDSGILSFTKYVATRMGSSRWDCLGQYTVDVSESDEETEE